MTTTTNGGESDSPSVSSSHEDSNDEDDDVTTNSQSPHGWSTLQKQLLAVENANNAAALAAATHTSVANLAGYFTGPGGRVSAKRVEVITNVIQVANIAPQATKEQMMALFGYIGKIEDLRLYPTMDIGMQHTSKICFVKFRDSACVGVAQHLTNTVFVDRALIVIPYTDGEAPDEAKGIELLNSGSVLPGVADPKLPQHVTSQLEGIPPHQVVITTDPKLAELQLPPYPNLPPTYDSRRIEEIRRTILLANIDAEVTANDLLELFGNAGEIKYLRMCTRDNDPLTYTLVEFTEQPAVLSALQCNGTLMGSKHIKVYHSTQAIVKPQAKTNEAAQKEIEEAMTRQAQNLITQGLDSNGNSKEKRRSTSPNRGRLSRTAGPRRSRTRSRSPRRRSGSRSRRRRSRTRSRSPRRSRRSSRSRSRGRVARSPWRHRSKSRSKERKRSSSKSRRSKRSSSKDKEKRREKDKKSKRDKDKERDKEKLPEKETKSKQRERDSKDKGKQNGVKLDEPPKEEVSRERDRDRDRHKDRERKRDKRKSHSKSPKDKRRSTSRERRKRSKNKKKKRGDSDREDSVENRIISSRNTSVDKESIPMDLD